MSDSEIPGDICDWNREVGAISEDFRTEVRRKGLGACEKYASGSKFTQSQFLCLHMLWPECKSVAAFAEKSQRLVTPAHMRQAREFWAGRAPNERQIYLSMVESRPVRNVDRDRASSAGAFDAALQWQDLVILGPPGAASPKPKVFAQRSTATRRSARIAAQRQPEDTDEAALSSPDTAATVSARSDETIVNSALIDLLNATCVYFTTSHLVWSPERKLFQMFEKLYRARSDGYLYGCSSSNVIRCLAIVEVKPYPRQDELDAIRRQESAQLAAWIAGEIDDAASDYLLISQDHSEIYVSFASFEDEYLQYLRDSATGDCTHHLDWAAEQAFCVVQSYGPFRIDCKVHMDCLTMFLTAFIMKQASEILDEDA